MNKEKNKIEKNDAQDIPAEEIKAEKEAIYPDEIEKFKNQLQEKDKELKDTLDRLLRVRADFDNYQKRAKKERQEFEKFASEGLIKNLLHVMDNLERAINSANETGDVAPLVKGIEMTIKQFKDTLKNAGLKEIASVGETFDPSKHEAIKLITEHEEAENKIVEEYEKGYLLHERVIRPSKVGVAKNASGGKDSRGQGVE
jgi:molecular chaperone GrpE